MFAAGVSSAYQAKYNPGNSARVFAVMTLCSYELFDTNHSALVFTGITQSEHGR